MGSKLICLTGYKTTQLLYRIGQKFTRLRLVKIIAFKDNGDEE